MEGEGPGCIDATFQMFCSHWQLLVYCMYYILNEFPWPSILLCFCLMQVKSQHVDWVKLDLIRLTKHKASSRSPAWGHACLFSKAHFLGIYCLWAGEEGREAEGNREGRLVCLAYIYLRQLQEGHQPILAVHVALCNTRNWTNTGHDIHAYSIH